MMNVPRLITEFTGDQLSSIVSISSEMQKSHAFTPKTEANEILSRNTLDQTRGWGGRWAGKNELLQVRNDLIGFNAWRGDCNYGAITKEIGFYLQEVLGRFLFFSLANNFANIT